MSHRTHRSTLLSPAILVASLLCLPATASAQLVISEFRLRGPNGANDEFIEIANNTGSDHTVEASAGSGYAIAASDGVVRCTIANGTVIPAGGHFLCVNPVGYSLGAYAAGNASYTTDIPDNAGIALFDNNVGSGSFSVSNRLDAVGSFLEANALYREGSGYPAPAPANAEYSFVRTGNVGASSMQLVDTNVNASDFLFIDTSATDFGAGRRLGAPGPQNLSSPIAREGTSFTGSRLDPCRSADDPANLLRTFVSDPASNSSAGRLEIRRTFLNVSGAPITRLRFRVIDITTLPATAGVADLRPLSSTDTTALVRQSSCGLGSNVVSVRGTTLEQPPAQPNGSGHNGSLSVDAITPGTPLGINTAINVRFVMGVQQAGAARFCVAAETVPAAGSQILCYVGQTEAVGTFANTTVIQSSGSGGPATPYPSPIAVSGLSGVITKLSVTIKQYSAPHPNGLQVLLVGPTGVSLILVSDAFGCGVLAATGQSWTFEANAGTNLNTRCGQNQFPPFPPSGTGFYLPTNYISTNDFYPSPAPGGPYLSPGPAGTASLAAFNGTDPNGMWNLYVVDTDGVLAGGWELTIRTSSLRRPAVDFNGDGVSDRALYRPTDGFWFTANQDPVQFGQPGDIPVPGDYDGDGRTDRAVYRPSTGYWYVFGQGAVQMESGLPNYSRRNIPVPADYAGRGSTQMAIYSPPNTLTATSTWLIRGGPTILFGTAGDIPVPADYNGDLVADIAVYRPTTGEWIIRNQSTIGWGQPGDIPVPGDYNGDGIAEIAVFRPATGQWFIRSFPSVVVWGTAADIPVPGDYNGDGITDIAVYRPLNGTWFVIGLDPLQMGGPGDRPAARPDVAGDINGDGAMDVAGYLGDFDGNGTTDIAVYRSTNGTWSVQGRGDVTWGVPGDIPAAGDYNGDGITDRAVFRPSNGTWYVHGGVIVPWGIAGDIPIPGDYNGDGITDIAIYRPTKSEFYIKDQFAVAFGAGPGDVPVPGDYNGDGITDIAVFRPSISTWFVKDILAVGWGLPGDIPIPGDYNGDGVTDVAVYRPATGEWFIRGQAIVQWGGLGDVPVPGDYNGDGITDIAVFRPSTMTWFVMNQLTVTWGLAGDIPASSQYTSRY